jgi:hypothetical protein
MADEARIEVRSIRDVPDYAEPIVRAIGHAAINWGKLDQHLEMLLRHVSHSDYVTGEIEKFPDTSFRIKSQLFKKFYAKHSQFAAVHDIARGVCVGLKKANSSRVALFHSNVQGFLPGPPPTIEVVIMKAEGENLLLSRGSWTAQQIEDFVDLACMLCDDLARISQAVMNEEFRESLRTR